MINIRDLSIKCGRCDRYQTLVGYQRRDDWNVYTYVCEGDLCEPEDTRTLVEVPRSLDEFASRSSDWPPSAAGETPETTP